MTRQIPKSQAGGLVRAIVLAAALVGGAAPLGAQAQPVPAAAPAALVGKPVRGADGKTLGVIEKVITAADGRIRQIQVRTRRGPVSILRTLPFASLKAEGDGFVSVLTQAEYDAIPASPEP
jgi:hypothetical protein